MRPPRWLVMLLVLLCLYPAVAAAAPQVPSLKDGVVQDETSEPMPEPDLHRLTEALTGLSGRLRFKILLIDDGGAEPWPNLPDAVRDAWQLPDRTILLVVGTNIGGKIRFYLYPGVSAAGVNPENTLAALKAHYSPAVRDGRLVDGLIAFTRELDRLAWAPASAPGDEQPAQPKPSDEETPGDQPPRFTFKLSSIDWQGLLHQPWLPWALAGTGLMLVVLGWQGVGVARGPRSRT